jgi:hypothetical protein
MLSKGSTTSNFSIPPGPLSPIEGTEWIEHNLISMSVTPLSSQNVILIQLGIVIRMVDLTGFKTYICKP